MFMHILYLPNTSEPEFVPVSKLNLTAGYLGDGQGDVPAGSLHRADGVPHLRPHHSRHHSGEVSHQHQSNILFSSPSKYGSKQENYNETE